MSPRYTCACAAALGLALATATGGCDPVPDTGDPTPIIDDDDDDDDDDVVDDDDEPGDVEFNGVTFNLTMDVASEDVGDDDDSADGNEERGRAYTMTVEHTIRYWVDVDNGIPLCDQVVRSQAEAWFGYGIAEELGVSESCPQFTGFIEIDPATVEVISDPTLDPDHCDLTQFRADQDYGTRLLSPTDPNAQPALFGDFLQMATLDLESHRILDFDLEVGNPGATNAPTLEAEYDEAGLEYVGAAFLEPAPGTLAATAGLDQVANPVGQGCDWLAGFQLFTNPADNDHDHSANTDLDGLYGGGAGFLLRFQAQ